MMKFGEVLLKLGYITPEKLDFALQEQKYNMETVGFSEPIGLIFLRNGIINEEQHNEAVRKYFEYLSEDFSVTESLRKIAVIAVRALANRNEETKLSHESKIALINKIAELEEKSSIISESNVEKKDLLLKSIERRINQIKNDLEKFG